MTQNQSITLVNNPHTQKAMAVLTKFAELETQIKVMKKEAEDATELIKEAMIAGGVDKVTVDMPGWAGYITLAERTNYSAEDLTKVAPRYLKKVLNTTAVGAQKTLTGELPAGVVESKTQYITKKFKAVE